MLMRDLLSLPQLDLPVKLIAFRNDALAFVQLEMKAAGILDKRSDGGHHPKNSTSCCDEPLKPRHQSIHTSPSVVWSARHPHGCSA